MKSVNQEPDYYLPGIAGKVIVVTGGAEGIGKKICLTLAGLGAKVAIIDKSKISGDETSECIRESGFEASFFHGDVCDEQSIKNCIDKIIKKWKDINVLINNAGITKKISFDKLTLEEWKKVLDVNLSGSFICSKAVYKYISRSGGGSIIMISSGSSLTGSGGGAHYAASKGGINSLTRSLSRELAPKGIRVNCVAPRYIKSRILSSLYDEEGHKRIIEEIPLRRLGKMEDIANVVSFLVSDLAAFITGEMILVDGGMTYGR